MKTFVGKEKLEIISLNDDRLIIFYDLNWIKRLFSMCMHNFLLWNFSMCFPFSRKIPFFSSDNKTRKKEKLSFSCLYLDQIYLDSHFYAFVKRKLFIKFCSVFLMS